MPAPKLTGTDLLRALQALLPRGRAWPKDSTAVQTKVLTGLAQSFADVAQRGSDLVADAFPPSTEELLPDWESTLGLPDPCQGVAPDLIDRRNQVVARFAGAGGQSVPYWLSLALTLGYTISIVEYAPCRFGINHYGDPLYGVAWADAWTVRSPTITPTFAEFGQSVFGDPYANWGNTVLQCEFAKRAPAHTVVAFQYT